VTSGTYVIVGASLAGAKAAETLRDEGFDGRVVLVGEEPERPYERPPLSKGYLLGTDEREKAYVHPAEWYQEHSVELLLGVRAEVLDPAAHRVELADGQSLEYTKLLLATGSVVSKLDLPGVDLDGVHSLRQLGHADRLKSVLGKGRRVVVIGAGWIGLETAAAARSLGDEATVVEMDSLPLRRVLGDELATVFRDLHVEHGVQFRFGRTVREFRGDGAVSAVVLDDGTELPADVVIVAVGIRPATALAEAAGLAVDNGVVVDASLRSSDPDIYAAGDVANFEHPVIGRRLRIEHWQNARKGGAVAARAMLGQDATYTDLPYFYTDQYDLGMEYTGYAEPGGYDQVVFRGDKDRREFIAFWLAGGRVLAGMNVNVWDVTGPIGDLVRAGYAGKPVDPAALSDPSTPLEGLLS
jgi:3-phenylpropionate/trans-cinnamate dioxygenase ferredoxin reductase component